jgi:hypothetical protein
VSQISSRTSNHLVEAEADSDGHELSLVEGALEQPVQDGGLAHQRQFELGRRSWIFDGLD